MGPARRNLELKVIDANPKRSLETCGRLGAESKGVLIQKDTYFNVPNGRLKLRRERGAIAHLIAYERSNHPGQRESRYRIVEVEDELGLEAALASVLGVMIVVSKRRQLFLFEGVRIHLDHVDGLGSFIEFEAVAAPEDADLDRFETLLSDLRRSFAIQEADLIGESYSDLLLAAADR
jgi:predicted adenylyl cyclase CyaB